MSGSGIADAAGCGSVLIPAMQRARLRCALRGGHRRRGGDHRPHHPPQHSLRHLRLPGEYLHRPAPLGRRGARRPDGYHAHGLRLRDRQAARISCRVARKLGASSRGRPSHAIPPMGMPIIILGGIIFGRHDADGGGGRGRGVCLRARLLRLPGTEAPDLPRSSTESVIGTAAVAIIISAAQPMGWILTYEQAPLKVLAPASRTRICRRSVLLLIINVIS